MEMLNNAFEEAAAFREMMKKATPGDAQPIMSAEIEDGPCQPGYFSRRMKAGIQSRDHEDRSKYNAENVKGKR